jgi:threonine dehydratase
MHRALAAGRPEDVRVGGVAADALGASRFGEIAMATALEHGMSSLLVEDEAIIDARRWLWREARVAAEPAGATALAALRTGGYVPAEDERVCVVVCGGNADPSGL